MTGACFHSRFRLKEAGEIIIKTMSDYWVVGKLSNLREFFVVIQQKSASIIDIEGTCDSLAIKAAVLKNDNVHFQTR